MSLASLIQLRYVEIDCYSSHVPTVCRTLQSTCSTIKTISICVYYEESSATVPLAWKDLSAFYTEPSSFNELTIRITSKKHLLDPVLRFVVHTTASFLSPLFYGSRCVVEGCSLVDQSSLHLRNVAQIERMSWTIVRRCFIPSSLETAVDVDPVVVCVLVAKRYKFNMLWFNGD